MRPKLDLQFKAVKFRKKGLSYSEIGKRLPVSKSSLSLWLKNIVLTDSQIHRLARKGDLARKMGSAALKKHRIDKTRTIVASAKSEIGKINKNVLMLLGTVLYWAEGSKQKEHNVSKEMVFSNSDPKMIRLYIKWLKECLEIPNERIAFEIYIHKSHKKSVEELVSYWSNITTFPREAFRKIYFKKNKVRTMRKNRGPNYSGVLRIYVRRSTDLNRKISGWIEGICLQAGVGQDFEL